MPKLAVSRAIRLLPLFLLAACDSGGGLRASGECAGLDVQITRACGDGLAGRDCAERLMRSGEPFLAFTITGLQSATSIAASGDGRLWVGGAFGLASWDVSDPMKPHPDTCLPIVSEGCEQHQYRPCGVYAVAADRNRAYATSAQGLWVVESQPGSGRSQPSFYPRPHPMTYDSFVATSNDTVHVLYSVGCWPEEDYEAGQLQRHKTGIISSPTLGGTACMRLWELDVSTEPATTRSDQSMTYSGPTGFAMVYENNKYSGRWLMAIPGINSIYNMTGITEYIDGNYVGSIGSRSLLGSPVYSKGFWWFPNDLFITHLADLDGPGILRINAGEGSPEFPTVQIAMEDFPKSLAVDESGNWLYTANGGPGLAAVDILDPDQLRMAASFPGVVGEKIAVDSNCAYVLSGGTTLSAVCCLPGMCGN